MQENNSGWTKRTIAEEPRLSELVEFYNELDFETEVRHLTPDDFADEMCTECMKMNMEKYKIIYTRTQTNPE